MSATPTHEMQYRQLGTSGLKVSVLSYGSWVSFHNQVDVKQAKDLMGQCFDAGVNYFDNAEVYAEGNSEIVMGEAIKDLKWKRSDIVLGTKVFWGGKGPNDKGLSRKHIIEGTKASLKRLDQEYVDLLFCHRPDPITPMEETVRAMNYVIDSGMAFYWGTSEWTAQQITEAWEVAKRLDLIGPTMEQPQYNLFERTKVESDYVPLYKHYGLGTTIWSPLAFGLLSGKYGKGVIPEGSRFAMESYKNMGKTSLVDEKLNKVDALKPIAEDLGCTLAQLSLAWCASNTNVSTAIMGATKVSVASTHARRTLEDNLQSLKFVDKLTPDLKGKIDEIMGNKPDAEKTYR